MFHIELRQFPNVARAFNLTPEDLQARILVPWTAGNSVMLEDRRWSPEKARLTIYEGRALRTDEIGIGRGWGNVTRSGEEVTARLLAEAEHARPGDVSSQELQRELLELVRRAPLPIAAVLALASEQHPGWRVSDRLAVAERAVWELLHHGQLRMVRRADAVDQDEWESLLLAWETWASQTPGLLLEAAADEP